jgi:hypothetical protein
MIIKQFELQILPCELILDCPWIRAVTSQFSLSVSLQPAPLQLITSVDASFIIINNNSVLPMADCRSSHGISETFLWPVSAQAELPFCKMRFGCKRF